MAAVVVDASAIVELLLRTDAGRRVATHLEDSTPSAPAHLDAEVLSALGRLARAGDLTADAVSRALRVLASAPIRRFELRPLLIDAWSMRDNVAQRDALYVALARRLGAALITADASLARATGLGVTTVFVGPDARVDFPTF